MQFSHCRSFFGVNWQEGICNLQSETLAVKFADSVTPFLLSFRPGLHVVLIDKALLKFFFFCYLLSVQHNMCSTH